ncbi:hypothetical protein G6L37_07085 [Agrobacterium rubi]|nr:hypothetical protein [Agrobacterium rubi]NTF25130.1 hypothetical protein [Agrobacterium rubi]
MIIDRLNEDEKAAVEKSLDSHRGLVRRFGKNPSYLKGMDTALLGYNGFGERLAADAIYKLDYVLHPKLAALKKGQDLHLDGVTFSHVSRKNGGLVATAVDPQGVQRFRVRWEPDERHKGKGDGSKAYFHVDLQSCPEKDPQYAYAERIGSAHLTRVVDDRVESETGGTLWSHTFFDFMDAMDLLRPALSAEILAMPRPRPYMENFPYSFSEMNRVTVLDSIRLDGGLPGRLCRHVFSVMLQERGCNILWSLTERATELAERLEAEEHVWGGAALTTRGRDNVHYAVQGADGKLGLFVNARNSSGPYTAFLIWKDAVSGTASIAAAKGGKDVFRVVGAFVSGEVVDAPTATINIKSGEHDIGSEIVGTAILDLALQHVRFLEEDLKELDNGEFSFEDRFERVDDFDFFIEANEDFYLDEDDASPAAADL